jgi:hypothetical protein
MPELPVKEIRLSELHLPEIKRDEIVRSLSEIRLPAVELPSLELPKIERRGSRFDWRSIDVGGAIAGATALGRLGRPLLRRSRMTMAVGAVVIVGLVVAAVFATPAVRERAGRTVRRVRDRVETRMTPSDVLEVEDDQGGAPTAGELLTDGTMSAPETPATPAIDGLMADLPAPDVAKATATAVSDAPDEATRPV